MTGWLPCHRRAFCRATLAFIAAVASGMLVAPLASAEQPDYDCTDFDSREDAQVFYEENGGPLYDPHNLDDDADGEACEEWEHDYDLSRNDENGSNGLDGEDRDCEDFASQREAQRYFIDDGGSMTENIDHLDANHNGVACESGEPG